MEVVQSIGRNMAKGLKIPVYVNNLGGSEIVEGDDQAIKIIKTALGSGYNENAYQQDVSLGESMIFGSNTNQLRADITRRLYKIFKEFEDDLLYKLARNTIKWSRDVSRQELILEFQFINLESDTPTVFRHAFRTGA